NDVIYLLKEIYPSAVAVAEDGFDTFKCPDDLPECMDKEKASYYGFATTITDETSLFKNAIWTSELYTDGSPEMDAHLGLYPFAAFLDTNLENGGFYASLAFYSYGARCVFE
ncbi:hypothetical protein IJZ97_04870, partial [bacterium]|nr:hypothetical protein [bacterium]